MKTKTEAENYIDSYLEEIGDNSSKLQEVISRFQNIKSNFHPFEYLFEFEIGKILQFDLEDLKNAEEYYNNIFQDIINDEENKGEFFFCLATMYENLNDIDKSKEYYNKCLNIYKDQLDEHSLEYQEICLRSIGQINESLKKFDDAIEYYLKADKVSRKTKYSGIALYLLGTLYSNELNENKTALEYSIKAEKLLQEEIYVLGNYRLLAHLHLMRKDYKTSISYCETIIKKYPNSEHLSDFYTILGKAYCYMKNEEQGILNLNSALQNINNSDSKSDEKYIYINTWIAMAEESRQNFSKAIKICSEIISKYKTSDFDLIFTISTKGRVLKKQGDYLTTYSFLKNNLKKYESSKFFDIKDEDYIDSVEIKNEALKKLPILNRLIGKLRN